MPKIGMEPIRRRALIEAAVEAIGNQGNLDVTVREIAHRAGVSPALAHHYFGGKDDLILATMRHLLSELGDDVRAALAEQGDGRARVRAIIRANMGERQFAPAVISAWLVFYVMAQSSSGARRLLRVYRRRLHSNLVDALSELVERDAARRIAEGAAAMIDGLYIRHALRGHRPEPEEAAALVESHVEAMLALETRR